MGKNEIQYVDLHVCQSRMAWKVKMPANILFEVFSAYRTSMGPKSLMESVPCLAYVLFRAFFASDAIYKIITLTCHIFLALILSACISADNSATPV